MEEQTIGLIILIFAVVSLISIVVGLILSKRKGDWPATEKWKTKKSSYDGFESICSYQNPLYENQFPAQNLSVCAMCVVQAWEELGYENLDKVKKGLKKTGLLISSFEKFPKITGTDSKTTAAVQMWFKTKLLEKRFPTVVVHTETIDKLISIGKPMKTYGEPAIHELCHAASEIGFKDPSYRHQDPRIWEATGRQNSLQAVAKRRLAEIKIL